MKTKYWEKKKIHVFRIANNATINYAYTNNNLSIFKRKEK